MRHHHTLGALALGSLAVALSAAPGAAQQRLTMGATHSASSFYAYQVGIANVLNNALENADINVRELGGAEVSTEALLRDEVDMGIAVTSSDYAAREGEQPFSEPAENLRTLYYFAPLPLNFVVAESSDIQSVEDLEGQPFNPGGRGTSTERQVEIVLETLGIEPDLMRAEGNDALDAYQNRQIEGFVKGGPHPDGYIQQAASSRPIRILSMTDEQIDQVTSATPYFSGATVPIGDNYGGGIGDIRTVQTAIGINTTASLDEETAYQIAKAVFSEEGAQAAAEVYAPADTVDAAELTLSAAVAPLHPGVIRYFEEVGKTVPERLIPKD